jgi:hypothetical protein
MNEYGSNPFQEIPTSVWVLVILFSIFSIYCSWRIFEKAGKPGWAALIPFYNVIVLLEIVGKPWWWLLLLFIPILNIVIVVWIYNLLSKSFGQGIGFTIGLVLLNIIFLALLALGDYRYLGPAGEQGGKELEEHMV